ncbi:MAG: DNA-formamidopyrimidine glycosylase [Verrucomicrobia bacterium RIFCSPLOWO2_12_FULL_64_8]|nr:MAG: DNA-formamidopyrimidine glycosylase [Verrucomicrobia bacterium RIFCSPLOWO2_12_FULL_64_8]
MPELAEVEFYRKQWNPGLGRRVSRVLVHPRARVFRGEHPARLVRQLMGATLRSSYAAAKQMLFQFDHGRWRRPHRGWLGVHLGMSGELRTAAHGYVPQKHDHLVLRQGEWCLVFSDPRMFGRITFSVGHQPPAWWTRLAPPVLSAAFTGEAVAAFLKRHGRAPIKAVLLQQERFPGIGNWMADEILWRAAIHPRRTAGSLTAAETRHVWRECRRVCRQALDAIVGRGDDAPSALNERIPDSWLFHHRWEDGGRCPITGARLKREVIGGRTTCWSPARQKI